MFELAKIIFLCELNLEGKNGNYYSLFILCSIYDNISSLLSNRIYIICNKLDLKWRLHTPVWNYRFFVFCFVL